MFQWPNRKVFGWALYDWANSAFATAVIAGFFPIFFKQYWSVGSDAVTSTWHLGLANSIAGISVALVAPLLGAIADRGGAKRRLLTLFALLGAAMTVGLALVSQGQWQVALVLYVTANIGFAAGNVFYDSLLPSVAGPRHLDFVSGFGFGLGYLGGGLLFAFDVWMTVAPQSFGLPDAAAAVRLSFVTVGLWWVVFTIPLLLWVPEPGGRTGVPMRQALRDGIRQFKATFKSVRRLRPVWMFLIAYWLYIDGVDTIVRMAVDYGAALGFESSDLILALLLVQFVGFPAAIAYGWMGQRIGAKRGLLFGIAAYCGITVWGATLTGRGEFYALAVAIGLVQGGVQALSRSYYARLIPPGQEAEFFGFYNIFGKFAAVIGPLLLGWVTMVSGDHRLGLLSVLLLLVLGGLLLWRVEEPGLR
jgi:UMF1 family MFS transporter